MRSFFVKKKKRKQHNAKVKNASRGERTSLKKGSTIERHESIEDTGPSNRRISKSSLPRPTTHHSRKNSTSTKDDNEKVKLKEKEGMWNKLQAVAGIKQKNENKVMSKKVKKEIDEVHKQISLEIIQSIANKMEDYMDSASSEAGESKKALKTQEVLHKKVRKHSSSKDKISKHSSSKDKMSKHTPVKKIETNKNETEKLPHNPYENILMDSKHDEKVKDGVLEHQSDDESEGSVSQLTDNTTKKEKKNLLEEENMVVLEETIQWLEKLEEDDRVIIEDLRHKLEQKDYIARKLKKQLAESDKEKEELYVLQNDAVKSIEQMEAKHAEEMKAIETKFRDTLEAKEKEIAPLKKDLETCKEIINAPQLSRNRLASENATLRSETRRLSSQLCSEKKKNEMMEEIMASKMNKLNKALTSAKTAMTTDEKRYTNEIKHLKEMQSILRNQLEKSREEYTSVHVRLQNAITSNENLLKEYREVHNVCEDVVCMMETDKTQPQLQQQKPPVNLLLEFDNILDEERIDE